MPLDWLLRSRTWFLAIFLGCAGLLGYGLYLQHALDLEPCPMCILQRYAFVGAGAVALLAGLHDPARRGVAVYSALVSLVAIAGAGVAARQTWLQHNPPRIADCGPDLEFMVGSFPLAEALPMIFRGSGDCSKVDWTFLGLSIAEWALVAFVGIVLASVFAWSMARRTPGRR